MLNSRTRCHQRKPISRCQCAVFAAVFAAIAASGVFSQSVDTLNILHTSDLHILYDVDDCHPAIAAKHQVVRGSVDSLRKLFTSVVPRMKVDAIVVTGDLLDLFEGETRSHKLLANQIEQFRSVCDQCPVPLYLTLGNHDLTKYVVRDADSTVVESQTSAARARASWIRNIPCFHDGTYYAKVVRVGKTSYHFIFLDNGYSLHDGGRVIDKTQLDWLQGQVSIAGGDPIILFFHIYFSVGDINGDGIFFKENGRLNWPSEKECSEGLLKILNEKGNIKAMVVGHGHSNVFEGIHFPSGHTIYQIETGSVTEGSMNWRLFQCTEKTITVSSPGSKKSEITISLHEKGE
jgi:3',5'-cyclic AMP phosphodiesterase CpdA